MSETPRPQTTPSHDALMRAVHLFTDRLRENGKQPATIESYGRDARTFVAWTHAMKIPPSAVEPGTLVAFEDFLRTEKHGRENSIRRTVIGIRLFYRFLVESGAHRGVTPFDEVPIPQRQEELPKGLRHEQIEDLFAAAAKDASVLRSGRNLAMLAALCYEGLKATELIQLTWGDWLRGMSFTSLQIRGGRRRSIILGEETTAYFLQWRQALEAEAAKGAPQTSVGTGLDQKIFVAFQGRDGLTLTTQMTRHGLKFVMYELGAMVGMKHLNTELLRHHAVSHLLSQGKTIEEIKAHLGLRRAGNVGKHAHAAKLSDEKL